jgi:TIR domain-containing protein/effector-associated domain 11 (EAD11)-containing protein
LIADNKMDRALQNLKDNIANYPDQQNQVTTLSAKFNELRKKENMGLLDESESFRFQSQLSMAVLELINDLEAIDNSLVATTANEMQQPANANSPGKKVFISYNHHDIDVANKLRDKLIAENITVFIDSEKMQAGEDIKEFIEKCVRETGTTISLVSTNSLLSAWVAMESINTFYHEKTDVKKKFIACYITDDFFKRNFTDNALDQVELEIKEIQNLITARMGKNRSIRDLQNELTRLTELRNNMDEIIRRLRERLCIDIKNENLDNNFQKILQAILT